MTPLTYLHACLKEGRTVRWPDSAMPIRVYIAPFRWYEKSKQQESFRYQGLITETLDTWQKISGGAIRFQRVAQLNDSQIDIKWRRVDRKSLGHCEYVINEHSLLYSAEIQIGLSDGILHAAYNDIGEVKHTILHEIGHALGLVGHSDGPSDIMYVPHQYGVTELSPRDIHTVKTLYELPPGFHYQEVGHQLGLEAPFSLEEVLQALKGEPPISKKPKPATLPEQPEVLDQHHHILSTMGKFYLSTQQIQLSPETKKRFLDTKKHPPQNP